MQIARILGRLVVVTLGLLIALIASTALVLATLGGRALASAEASRPFTALMHVIEAAFLFVGLAGASLPVWLVAALLGEALAWRSLYYYLATGAVSGGLAAVIPGAVPGTQDLTLSLATGLVAGLIYWAIAGRRAGAWGNDVRRSGPPPAPGSSAP